MITSYLADEIIRQRTADVIKRGERYRLAAAVRKAARERRRAARNAKKLYAGAVESAPDAGKPVPDAGKPVPNEKSARNAEQGAVVAC